MAANFFQDFIARVIDERRAHYRLLSEDTEYLAVLAGRRRAAHESYGPLSDDAESLAELAGRLRHGAEPPADLPVVGDWVRAVAGAPGASRAVIHDVLPRRSRIARRAAGNTTEEQVLAANVDIAFIVSSLNRDVSLRRLERYLTLARTGGVRPVIVLTKADVCTDPVTKVTEVAAAMPGVAVRLATPTGGASFATADSDGRWRIRVPSSVEPRLFGLSMSAGGRVVQAIGYLFIAPDGRTARLRAGGGSEVIEDSGGGLHGLVVDYDTQRAATLSGRAPPGAPLSLRVDGVERGQATAGADGRFVMPINQPLNGGNHNFDLVAADKEEQAQAAIGAPVRLTSAPFLAIRSGGGWRIDWLTPGGGEQTTLILRAADRAP